MPQRSVSSADLTEVLRTYQATSPPTCYHCLEEVSRAMSTYLDRSVSYIERHLGEGVTIDDIAQAAGAPASQIHAAFLLLVGMTPLEYARKRTLSLAASRLMEGATVTDVAFASGYTSVEGFSRAFRAWSGMSPSDVLRDRSCRLLTPLRVQVKKEGGTFMEYRVREMPSFRFAGVSRRVPMRYEGVNTAIVDLAMSITDAQRKELHRLQDMEPRKVVNVSWNSDSDFQEESGQLTHLIGVPTTSTEAKEGLGFLEVPAGLWAVFPCDGPHPQRMQETTAAIYADWLGQAPYVLDRFAMFSFSDIREDGGAYSEIWVPVRRRPAKGVEDAGGPVVRS